MKNVPGKKFVTYIILSVGVLMTMGYASAQQGHPWSEIILPIGTTWVGLDADMVDGYHWSDVTALLLWGSSGANVFNLNSGNVGIGTNSPSQQLDVDGSLRVRGLAGCDTIDTDGDGNLVCGSDAAGLTACSQCNTDFVNEGQGNSITSSMIVDGAVANADLANGAVTSSKIQDGTIGSADINSGQVQRRVTGGCSGQVVVDVNQDGSLVCEPDDVGSSGISCSDCDSRFINVGESGDSIADNTIDNTEIQDGTIGSADINSGQVQRRVTETCSGGSAITAISSSGGVTCGGGSVTWTSLNIGLGNLPSSATTQSYNIPGDVPGDATEVLVWVYSYSGNAGSNTGATYYIYTEEGSEKYTKKHYIHRYPQNAISYSSDNLWFPVTSDRKIYANLRINLGTTNRGGGIYVIGYR